MNLSSLSFNLIFFKIKWNNESKFASMELIHYVSENLGIAFSLLPYFVVPHSESYVFPKIHNIK